MRIVIASLGMLVVVAAIVAQDSEINYVARDSFYDPPSSVPEQPGSLVRSEQLIGREVPAGARAWRMLYTTTFADGKPVTAVATVLAPGDSPAQSSPVIMWVHGTVGLTQQCMPSLWMEPFAGIPAVEQALAEGWVIVATDYATEGRADSPHQYLIGEGEARSGLDSVRAARQIKELTLDADRAAVWGHSQGGGSALWVGIVGPRYAPDVALAGVGAIAPAADLARIVSKQSGAAVALLTGYLAIAFSHFYPDVKFEEVITPEAQDGVRQLGSLCALSADGRAKTAQIFQTLNGSPPVPDLTTGALGARVEENTPRAPITAPLLIAQGLSDDMVPAEATNAFVKERCAAGQSLEYVLVQGGTHQSVVGPGSPLEDALVNWTRERLAGKPQPKGCTIRTMARN